MPKWPTRDAVLPFLIHAEERLHGAKSVNLTDLGISSTQCSYKNQFNNSVAGVIHEQRDMAVGTYSDSFSLGKCHSVFSFLQYQWFNSSNEQ